MNFKTGPTTIREFLIITAFALSIFFVRFDGFIINLAMPTFVKTFDITVSQASWVALSYILAQVSAIMIFGNLCDRFDLKKIFLQGMAVFVAASLLCGVCRSFWFLIAFRCLQGLGGSMMLVSAYAAIVYYLPHEKVGWGMGIMTTSAALGVILGPVVGGLIINDWDWHWLFLINVPLGILAIIYSRYVIPDIKRPIKPLAGAGRVDYAGAAFSAAALFLLIYLLNTGREWGWTSWVIKGAAFFSTVFFVVFYFREKKRSNPLLDVRLFNNRSFTLTVLAGLIGFFLFFGGNFLLPFYLTREGVSPKHIGLLLAVFSVVYIPIGLYAGSLSDRISPRKLVCWAMLLSAATGCVFALTTGSGGIWFAVLYLVMSAVSYGLFFSPINHLIMSFASRENRGSVSAVYNTVMAVTMALGVVLLETIYSEFNVPGAGFSAAFCAGGLCCLAAAALLGWFVKDATPGNSRGAADQGASDHG